MWSTGINRNIVECKGAYPEKQMRTPSVLIETLWNVKDLNFCHYSLSSFVLIETLWNVKMQQLIQSLAACGCINRNIVECKA